MAGAAPFSPGMPFALPKGLYVAGVSHEGKLMMAHSAHLDKPWTPLPPPPSALIAPPTLVAYSGALFVFVVCSDRHIHYNVQAFAGVWGGWTTIPDGTTRGSVAAVLFRGNLSIFVLGDDGHIYMKTLKDSWGEWQNIVAEWKTDSAPTVAVVKDKLIVLAHDSSRKIVYLELEGDRWGPLMEIPGGYRSFETIGALTLPDHSLLVIIRGTDDRVYEHVRAADGTWRGYREFHPNSLITSAPALGLHGPNAMLFVRSGAPGLLLLTLVRDTATGKWTDFAVSGPLGAMPFAVGVGSV